MYKQHTKKCLLRSFILIFLSPSFGKLFKYFFVVRFYPLFLGVMKYD